ncbi:MAG: STAS domain-containing protein [Actinomycetota bacterium]
MAEVGSSGRAVIIVGVIPTSAARGPQATMSAVIESNGADLAVCRLAGALDAEGAEQLREAMAECAAFRDVYLDLSHVRFMDSTALSVIIVGVRRARENGGEVSVCGVRGNIARLLTTVGFDRVAPIHETVPAVAAGTLVAAS